MKRKFIPVILILIIFTLIGVTYSFRHTLLKGMGEYLVVSTPLQRADLIVALGGSRLRQREAVNLLREGFATWIMITDAETEVTDYPCLGISSKEAILPPIDIYTTYDEAVSVKKIMEERNFRSVIVITSPFHLRRSSFIFHKVIQGKDRTIIFYPSKDRAFQSDAWWKSHISRKIVLMEYLSLLYYWVKY